jgi:hypothetical protein
VRVEKNEIVVCFGLKLATCMVEGSEFTIKLCMCYTVLTVLRDI